MCMGELIALRWRDVDWKASKIRVRSNYVLGEFGSPKSKRPSRGVPMRTLQEWMGHRDIETTQRYADYAPGTRDAELVAAAFSRGAIRGANVTEPLVISAN
jgi:integrase